MDFIKNLHLLGEWCVGGLKITGLAVTNPGAPPNQRDKNQSTPQSKNKIKC